jgi:hypothetical protein
VEEEDVMPWRRPPGSSAADWRAIVRVALVVLAGLLLAVALLGGCAAPQVECPLGTMPLQGVETRSASGSGSASVSVPTASGSGSGGYQTTGSATVRCGAICGARCLRASDDGRSRTIECYDCSTTTSKPVPAAPPTGGHAP